MPINITMPALSPTMEEGTLSKWLVGLGDTVEAGDVIAEIETDKATMEIEAVDEGVVAQILIEAGSEGACWRTRLSLSWRQTGRMLAEPLRLHRPTPPPMGAPPPQAGVEIQNLRRK